MIYNRANCITLQNTIIINLYFPNVFFFRQTKALHVLLYFLTEYNNNNSGGVVVNRVNLLCSKYCAWRHLAPSVNGAPTQFSTGNLLSCQLK